MKTSTLIAAATNSIHSTEQRHKACPHPSGIGHYPEMELELAEYVKNLRLLGVPVDTWMIREEAKRIFCKKNPEKYPTEEHISIYGDEELEYPLKLSAHWMSSFLSRHNFSYRKLSTKMNKKEVSEPMLAQMEQYHLSMRMKQLSAINDPEYGLTSPYYVISHDQVPLELAANVEKTIDTEGVRYDMCGLYT